MRYCSISYDIVIVNSQKEGYLIMRHPAFTFAPNFINNQNKSSMAIKKVSNEFMAKVLNDVAWKALSNTSNEILFHEECIEHFKNYWD